MLERYARVFNAVEINSSFYRSHRRETYRRWADTVPDDFAFAVKLPRAITHVRKLTDSASLIEAFADETSGLGAKRQEILIQLPPGLRFEPAVVRPFLHIMRNALETKLLCEPRHATWFTKQAEQTLVEFGIARVAADPPPAEGAQSPGGAEHTAYFRLHGSPHMYYSPYDLPTLEDYAREIRKAQKVAQHVWCIFDNTAAFHATRNARELQQLCDNAAVNAEGEPCSDL